MSARVPAIVIGFAGLLLAACATSPPQQGVSGAREAHPEEGVKPCDAKASASESGNEASGELDPCTADLAALTAAGYKVVNRDGQRLYCRRDFETGSRIRENTFCLTAAQLEQIRNNTKDAFREMSRDTAPKGD